MSKDKVNRQHKRPFHDFDKIEDALMLGLKVSKRLLEYADKNFVGEEDGKNATNALRTAQSYLKLLVDHPVCRGITIHRMSPERLEILKQDILISKKGE